MSHLLNFLSKLLRLFFIIILLPYGFPILRQLPLFSSGFILFFPASMSSYFFLLIILILHPSTPSSFLFVFLFLLLIFPLITFLFFFLQLYGDLIGFIVVNLKQEELRSSGGSLVATPDR
jgi:signal transduction histidine kinase